MTTGGKGTCDVGWPHGKFRQGWENGSASAVVRRGPMLLIFCLTRQEVPGVQDKNLLAWAALLRTSCLAPAACAVDPLLMKGVGMGYRWKVEPLSPQEPPPHTHTHSWYLQYFAVLTESNPFRLTTFCVPADQQIRRGAQRKPASPHVFYRGAGGCWRGFVGRGRGRGRRGGRVGKKRRRKG